MGKLYRLRPTKDNRREIDKTQSSPVQAIRKKCLDCTGFNKDSIRNCGQLGCSLRPFRMMARGYDEK